MSNLETAKRMADLLESRDKQGLQALLADDFKAKTGTHTPKRNQRPHARR